MYAYIYILFLNIHYIHELCTLMMIDVGGGNDDDAAATAIAAAAARAAASGRTAPQKEGKFVQDGGAEHRGIYDPKVSKG